MEHVEELLRSTVVAFRAKRGRIDAERASQADWRGDQMIAGAGDEHRNG